MQHKRWQGKVVDHLGFIVPIPKVADVTFVGHVCFCDQFYMRGAYVQKSMDAAHDAVYLREMDAASANLLPDICDSVQADKFCACGNIQQQGIEHFQQDAGIFIIKIDLVSAKSSPKEINPMVSIDFREER